MPTSLIIHADLINYSGRPHYLFMPTVRNSLIIHADDPKLINYSCRPHLLFMPTSLIIQAELINHSCRTQKLFTTHTRHTHDTQPTHTTHTHNTPTRDTHTTHTTHTRHTAHSHDTHTTHPHTLTTHTEQLKSQGAGIYPPISSQWGMIIDAKPHSKWVIDSCFRYFRRFFIHFQCG